MVGPWCRVRPLALVGPRFIVGSMVTHCCKGSVQGFSGVYMVGPWSGHGGSVVPPWCVHVDSMVSPCLHEPFVVLPWWCQDCATIPRPSGAKQSQKSLVLFIIVLEKAGRFSLVLLLCWKVCRTSTSTTRAGAVVALGCQHLHLKLSNVV